MSPRLAFLLIASVGLAACGRAPQPAARSEAPELAVSTLLATSEDLPSHLEVPATVRPAQRAVVAAQLSGTILEIAPLGQALPAGKPLVRLTSPDADARLQVARAQLAEAERIVSREKELVDRRVNPPEALLAAEDSLRIARASVASAEALLSHTVIVAPFAGVVGRQHALMGDLATPGAALLVFESTQDLRAEGAVPESAASQLRLGDSLPVRLEGSDVPVPARIEELAPSVDPESHTVFVKAALDPSTGARSGQFARFLIPLATSRSFYVPVSSIVPFGQMERIFVVAENRAQLRLVKTGRVDGNRIEILSGLSPGESVVTAPPPALRDGQRVSPTLAHP